MIDVFLLIGYSSDRASSFILILLPASSMIRKIRKNKLEGQGWFYSGKLPTLEETKEKLATNP